MGDATNDDQGNVDDRNDTAPEKADPGETVDLTKGKADSEADASEDGAAAEEGPSAPSTKQTPSWTKPVTIVASVLIVVLLGVGTWLVFLGRSASDEDRRREEFLLVARQTALNLTNIGVETAEADVQRLIDGSTGDFKAEFEGRSGPFVEVVQAAGVNSTGEIAAAGVQSESDDGACIASLVAVNATVSNVESPEPEGRSYRLRVNVCEVDGQLLASNVEFVP